MKQFTTFFGLIVTMALFVSCGTKAGPEKVVKSAPAGNNLTVSLSAPDGVLKHGASELTLSFLDASGNPVDVGAVGLSFHMPAMGTMAEMNDAATLTTSNTPGVYRGKANITMSGEWQARITYEGSAGSGQATFPVTAR